MGSTQSRLKGESREDTLRRLLKDPNFRLIKVVRKGRGAEIESLTVVTPALDRAVARDVKKFGWKCVSHIWGPESTWTDWDGPEVVSAHTGKVLTARLQPNKSGQIINMFETWAGYWWMDVFCARSETPLVIMGDIYSLSSRCIALIDTSLDNLNIFVQRLHHHMKTNMEPDIERCVQHYLDVVVNNSAKATLSLHQKMKNETDSQKKEIFEHFIGSSEEELHKAARSCVPDSLEYTVIKDIAHARDRDRWEALDVLDYAESISTVLDSQWMSRVWMIQESALPFIVTVECQGEDKRGLKYETAASFYYLQKALQFCLQITAKAFHIRREAVIRATTSTTNRWDQEQIPMSPGQLLKFYQDVDPPLARIYTDYRKLIEAVLALGANKEYGDKVNMGEIRLLYLNTFATSQRKATNSLDYVYGVLGIMGIDIPPMDDAKEIWRLFSEKLQAMFPNIRVPRDIDLMNAAFMEDVYANFGFINDGFMSAPAAIVDFIGERDSGSILDCFDN